VVREIVGDQSRGRPIWSPTIPRIEAPKQVDASSGVCPIHHRSPVPHWAIPAARSPLDTIAVATGGPKGAPDGGTQAVVPPLCGGRRWGAPPRSGGGRNRLRFLHQTSTQSRATSNLLELVAHEVPKRRPRLAGVGKPLGIRQIILTARALDRQADLALVGVELDDLGAARLAGLEHGSRIVDPLLADLRDVDQTLDAGDDLRERAEVGELEDLDLGDLADRELVGHAIPRVARQL